MPLERKEDIPSMLAKITSPDTMRYMGNDDIGSTIRRLREQAGMPAKDMAEALELDPSAMSNIESGKRAVKTQELAKIARILGVSPLAILEPDSLLARLPMAARSATSQLSESVSSRLQALAELHVLLHESAIEADRDVLEPPPINPSRWLDSATNLATWALSQMNAEEGSGRFESLANAIERDLGIDVLVESSDDHEVLGAAITDGAFPFVFVNAHQPRSRALFTLAHELGHVLARDGETLTVEHDMSGVNSRERLANAFASELLMPENDIRTILHDLGKTAAALGEIMKRYQVSFESMVYRLHNLGLINDKGREAFQDLGFGGLLAQLESAEDRSFLLALRADLAQKRPPQLLLERMLRGYYRGVLSVRPLAEILDQDPDDLIENLSSKFSDAVEVRQVLDYVVDREIPQDVRFAGQPA